MEIWIAAGMALAITTIAAPFVLTALMHHGVVDLPNGRSSHNAPTPRGGGIACALGVASGGYLAALSGSDVPWTVIAAALALALVGFLDDRLTLSAVPRLAAQLVVGAGLGLILGGATWALLGAVLVPAVVNIVNFMDGINGITAVTIAIWGGTAVVAGLANGVPALTIVGALTIGATLGFLPWNAPRAQMFLGDVGSYLLGALAAGGVILGSANSVPLLVLLAPLAIYIADTGVTLVRRGLRKAPLLQAHREHVYQALVHEAGFSHTAVCAWVGVTSGAVSVAWLLGEEPVAALTTAGVVSLYLASPTIVRLVRAAQPVAAEVSR